MPLREHIYMRVYVCVLVCYRCTKPADCISHNVYTLGREINPFYSPSGY